MRKEFYKTPFGGRSFSIIPFKNAISSWYGLQPEPAEEIKKGEVFNLPFIKCGGTAHPTYSTVNVVVLSAVAPLPFTFTATVTVAAAARFWKFPAQVALLLVI